jgi:hypothetical protein
MRRRNQKNEECFLPFPDDILFEKEDSFMYKLIVSLRGFSIVTAMLCLAVIGLKFASSAKAPHPGGGSTTVDFSSMYGSLYEWLNVIYPYAVVGAVLAVIGIIFFTYRIKNSW